MPFVCADRIEYSPDSLFSKSEKTGLDYILAVDADRLLAPSFEAHGLSAPNGKKRYGGWEAKSGANWFKSPDTFTLAGHSLGHYMSALAHFYKSTGRSDLLDRINNTMSQLDYLQKYTNSGYIGGCEMGCFERLFSGDAEGWTDGYWVPWYGVHKIYKGLIDIYSVTRSRLALTVLIRFADWAYEGLKGLNDGQFEKMLETEYGGMNEVFANLHEFTNERKYLDLAVRFTQKGLLESLANGKDCLEGLHANTQIPKVIGMAAVYRASPDEFPEYRKAAEFFWETVVNNRSYAIGGNSAGEHFESAKSETLTEKTCESCNSYNMLRLTKYLYEFEPKAEYFDYYERVLYNHILPQQERNNGSKMYFVSLLPGHHKTYEKKYESWWCCTGTGMENPALYKGSMVFENENGAYINIYSPCRFKLQNGFEIEIKTAYPYSKRIELSVVSGEAEMSLHFRIPKFAEGFEMSINGEEKDGYYTVKHLWKTGDTAVLTLHYDLAIYKSRNSGEFAYTYGPLTLAARLGKVSEKVNEYIFSELDIDMTRTEAPKIKNNSTPKPSDSFAHFIINKNGNTLNRDIELVPFGETEHEFYSVYFKYKNV